MNEIKFYAFQILDATLKKGLASYADADKLKELTGLSDEQLSDAVDYLEDQLAVKPLRGGENYAPGVTLRFASIIVTTRGRMLYRELGEDIKPALILKEQSATVQLPSAARKLRVFLCHGKEDKVSVMGIYERLAEDGFESWLDAKKSSPWSRLETRNHQSCAGK